MSYESTKKAIAQASAIAYEKAGKAKKKTNKKKGK